MKICVAILLALAVSLTTMINTAESSGTDSNNQSTTLPPPPMVPREGTGQSVDIEQASIIAYEVLGQPQHENFSECYIRLMESFELEKLDKLCDRLPVILKNKNPCHSQPAANAMVFYGCIPPVDNPDPYACGVSPGLKATLTSAPMPSTLTTRIVGGRDTGSCEMVPWHVMMYQFGGLCSGVIIGDRYVLTAAHCAAKVEHISKTQVSTGDYDSEKKDGYERHTRVERVTIYPSFDASKGLQYDIAIVKLKSPIPFNKCTKAACMKPGFRPDFRFCVVSGWGRTHNKRSTKFLKAVDLKAFKGPACNERFSIPHPTYLSLPEKQVCAGDFEGKKDSCSGDSGGPLVCLDTATNSYVLVGIASYGGNCTDKNYPGVYTEVDAFRDWIERNMDY